MPSIDKSVSNAYIWYSPATDVTGKKLAATLGLKHGSKQPTLKDTSLVIGWGAKTKDAVSLGKLPTLNHPDKIRLNRNKFSALQAMEKAGVSVAAFIDASDIAKIGAKGSKVALPMVGRTRYHQGGKGFWNCPTMTHVNAAIQEGAQYFQNLIEIKDEFRLHTFGDKVIYAVKKAKRTAEETAEAYVRQELEKQKGIAEKKGQAFDETTAKAILEQQSKQFAQNGANMLVRSNRLGWKFVRVKTVDKALEAEAVKSLKAIGLSFGAVDCCIDADGKPYIIEVNTGPGLEETTFDIWVAAFTEAIQGILNPKSLGQKVVEKVTGKSTVAAKTADSASAKEKLKTKVQLMQEMVEAADEAEAAVLDSVFNKMFK